MRDLTNRDLEQLVYNRAVTLTDYDKDAKTTLQHCKEILEEIQAVHESRIQQAWAVQYDPLVERMGPIPQPAPSDLTPDELDEFLMEYGGSRS